ncbi:MAG: hypothetical protein PHS09_00845 [Candidatus Omnitrophica bacterium]|jgi:hypothetical protein|nr:hypothetical protein [Candidatus Omnitrophota bacterium]MDD5512172.1 hypothetical protein [Candidatus Omnitrophota bacterium]
MKKKRWITPELKIFMRKEDQELVLAKCHCGAPPGGGVVSGAPICACMAIYTCQWNSSPSGS